MTTVNVAYHVNDDTAIKAMDLSDNTGHPAAVLCLGSWMDDGQLRVIVHDPTDCDRIIEAVRTARAAVVAAHLRDQHTGQLVG